MFEWLFNYPIARFQAGHVELSIGWPSVVMLGLAVVVVCYWWFRYRALAGGWPGRMVLWARVILTLSLLLALLDPRLVTPAKAPSAGSVVVIVDDSLSMRTASRPGHSRGAEAWSLVQPGKGTLSQAIEAGFEVRYFSAGTVTRSISHTDSPRFDSPYMNLGHALDTAARERPSAVVFVSDGGGEMDASVERALLALRAAGAPVHSIAVGQPPAAPDIEVVSLESTRRSLIGSAVTVKAALRHVGLAGQTVTVSLEVDGLREDERQVTFGDEAQLALVSFEITPSVAGPRSLRVTAPPVAKERLVANNSMVTLVHAIDREIRVLHFEAEPRYEVKFVRRALGGDANVALISLVRTANNKFYRLGVGSSDELADGFPTQLDALFAFDMVILGSVAVEDLSEPQQRALEQFVVRRGGSLLLLGGTRSFAQGGWGASSRLRNLLPVVLPERQTRAPVERLQVRVVGTPAARAHAVGRLAFGSGTSLAFDALPTLSVVNPLTTPKPGARVLWHGEAKGQDRHLVMLAEHRYGRGNVAVMPARNLWRWQMHATIPLADQTHELIWLRLTRGMGDLAPRPFDVRVTPAHAAPGQRIIVEVEALDKQFEPRSRVPLQLSISVPGAQAGPVKATWQSAGAGIYRTELAAPAAGPVEIEVSDTTGQSARTYLGVHPNGDEFALAAPQRERLETLSKSTGGQVFDAGNAQSIVTQLAEQEYRSASVERLVLWNAPLLLLIALLSMGGEWMLRRQWGMA
ncbi:MAG: hypothetical protein HOI95_13865 [Chromatiales bacterium]|jgi:hypothetical protein|nr:hypothetical protein [Chromatiales bacterium]